MIQQRSHNLGKMKHTLEYQPVPTQFKSCLPSKAYSWLRQADAGFLVSSVPTDLSFSFYIYCILVVWKNRNIV